VIGAGLPLFQRLKLLRQKELEQERKEGLLKLQQTTLEVPPIQPPVMQQSEASNNTIEVTVEAVPKSPPPPPPLPSSQTETPKGGRHISFLEKPNENVASNKPAGNKWTLAVGLPGRSGGGGKFGNRRVLDTVHSAEENPPLTPNLPTSPPIPPPPPPPPPFWQATTSAPGTPPTPPLPLPAAKLASIRGRKKPPRRAMTLRPETDFEPPPPAKVTHGPLRPPFTAAMSQYLRPWHHPRSNSEQMQRSAAAAISRQNTIQVVSDVQGVLTDILLDIVPYPAMATTTVAQQPPVKDYGPPAPLSAKGRTLSRAMTLQQPQQPLAGPEAWRAMRQESLNSRPPPPPPQETGMELPKPAVRPKRLNLRQCKNTSSRDYNSIDDLSPEYTVLPFVKRLKILNERQKIAELQRALTVVGGSQNISGEAPATTTADQQKQPESGKPSANEEGPSIVSAIETINQQPENSNETPERVTLKKMLKSASRKELLEPQDQSHLKKLLRSQTVEGYAVRHANFTKLNYQRANAIRRIAQTLPSPPVASIGNFTTDEPSAVHHSNDCAMVPHEKSPAIFQKQMDLGTKEECVAELLTAIKTVLQERLVISAP